MATPSSWTRAVPIGPRCVVHMDLDCFYASVEELENPALRGKPVAVVMGLDANGHGVVATASYAARAFGVHSAAALSAARRLCPDLIALPVRHELYRRYSDRVMSVLHGLSSVVQQISIDEAFADLTGSADAVALAREVRDRIQREIGLPASFGIATGKLTAKIATSQGKPQGFVVVPGGTEAAFLAPLSVEKLWGVGPRTAERLRELGLATLGELAAYDPADLAATFGPRRAIDLCRTAQGIDDSP
ncbi:MAG: DNA polymerase Y family protein, partial [Chloroflexota bacterium]